MSNRAFKLLAAVSTAASLLCISVPTHTDAFTARNLVIGSRGYDVDELQNRLALLGFYHGKVNGHFGWSTYWAVRNFQWRFGMKPDGKVDLKTKQHLVAATKNWRYKPAKGSDVGGNPGSGSAAVASAVNMATPVSGLSRSDINLMAHVVYGEARGEPHVGQVAIADVILNRLHDPRFPHSVPAIVYQPGAFTAVSDGQVNLQPNQAAFSAVMEAVHGADPVHGAVYYFNPSTATNKWIWSRPQIMTIGHHIFCD